MAAKSLDERVAVIETQLGGKTLQEHFREQAELIDRRFDYHFGEFEKRWEARLDRKLGNFERSLAYRLGKKFDERFESIESALKVILLRLPERRSRRKR